MSSPHLEHPAFVDGRNGSLFSLNNHTSEARNLTGCAIMTTDSVNLDSYFPGYWIWMDIVIKSVVQVEN